MSRARVSALRAQLEALLARGLEAVHAGRAAQRALQREQGQLRIAGRPVSDEAQLVVAALGKAASAMARSVEQVAGDRIRGGLVITKDGHAEPRPARLPVREAAHPVPDHRGEAAAKELLALAAGARRDDVLLVLLSGGASALTTLPASGLELVDLRDTTAALLACGAEIAEVNAVRKHISSLAGGRLAAAAGCSRIEVVAVSDVPGDRLDTIGSGPCEPDPSYFADALAVLERYAVRDRLPSRVVDYLERGLRGELPETPKPGALEFPRVRSHIVARNGDALEAAAKAARAAGARPIVLPGALRGEARSIGRRIVVLARAIEHNEPVVLIAGGETVVTVRGAGRGGRSQELALAAALELAAHEPSSGVGREIALLASGTDGTDGPTDAAGAFADAGSVARAAEQGLSAQAALADNDSYTLFAAEGGLLMTGPTETNVMDLVLVWIEPRSG